MSKKMYIEVEKLPNAEQRYMAQDYDGSWFYYKVIPKLSINGNLWLYSGGSRYAGYTKPRKDFNQYYYEIIR